MDGTARILHPQGELLLPACSPYDLELLLDHVHWYAWRYGGVRVELEDDEWLVTARSAEGAARCSSCRERLTDLLFTNGSRQPLCQRCSLGLLRSSAGPHRLTA
jgi:hypothetical protein